MILRLALILFVSLALYAAERPVLYQAIGDPIYQAQEAYEALLAQPAYGMPEAARSFVDAAKRLREEGLALGAEPSTQQRQEYIKALRILSHEMLMLQQEVDKSLERLFEQKAYPLLSRLQNNAYPYLRTHPLVAEAKLMIAMEKGEVDMTALSPRERLFVTLDTLKKRLLKAREEGSGEADCLNDVTAVNYWMLKAEEFKEAREPCKGLEACEHIERFLQSAKKSCGETHPMFSLSRESSSLYRLAIKTEFYEACR